MDKIKEVVPTTQRKPEIISPLNLGEEKKKCYANSRPLSLSLTFEKKSC